MSILNHIFEYPLFSVSKWMNSYLRGEDTLKWKCRQTRGTLFSFHFLKGKWQNQNLFLFICLSMIYKSYRLYSTLSMFTRSSGNSLTILCFTYIHSVNREKLLFSTLGQMTIIRIYVILLRALFAYNKRKFSVSSCRELE